MTRQSILSRRPETLAVATSIVMHATAIGVLAAFAVVPHVTTPAPVRVVIIDAEAGGGGSRGPLRPAAAGQIAGPPAPAVIIEQPPPPPMPSVPEAPRIAARPQKETKRKPAPRRAAAATPRKPRAEPTPGSGVDGNSQLALSTASGGSGGGGGGGNGTGGGSGSGIGTGAGSGRGPGVESAIAKYLRTVRTRLEAVKRYPILARRRGTEGTATLAIDIERDGHARAVRVSDSSGSELLDEEAAEMVGRAAPFDPLPVEVDESTLRVVVPVSFDLGS